MYLLLLSFRACMEKCCTWWQSECEPWAFIWLQFADAAGYDETTCWHQSWGFGRWAEPQLLLRFEPFATDPSQCDSSNTMASKVPSNGCGFNNGLSILCKGTQLNLGYQHGPCTSFVALSPSRAQGTIHPDLVFAIPRKYLRFSFLALPFLIAPFVTGCVSSGVFSWAFFWFRSCCFPCAHNWN